MLRFVSAELMELSKFKLRQSVDQFVWLDSKQSSLKFPRKLSKLERPRHTDFQLSGPQRRALSQFERNIELEALIAAPNPLARPIMMIVKTNACKLNFPNSLVPN